MRPYLRDCPLEVQKQQLRYAARDFLRKTEVWRETLPIITSVIDDPDYTLLTTNNAVFHRVREVTVDDATNKVLYELDDSGLLTLTSSPNSSGLDITVKCVFIPLESNSTYPDWLLNRWGGAITNGALFFLKSMVGMPWGSPSEIGRIASIYARDVSDGILETNTNRIDSIIQVKHRSFV